MSAELRKQQAADAWRRFNEQVTDELLRAVSGAFAVVACADGALDDKEIALFVDMIKDAHAFDGVDIDALERQFRDLSSAIVADFDNGRQLALDAIAQVQGEDTNQTALVVSAAQIALLADDKLKSAEEDVLGQICERLGLDPASY